jgi:putative FmdB family regulatory protein
MPIFTFKCQTCNSTFDKLVKRDVVVAQCLQCSELATKQVSAPAVFNLIGDGFYAPTVKTKSS